MLYSLACQYSYDFLIYGKDLGRKQIYLFSMVEYKICYILVEFV